MSKARGAKSLFMNRGERNCGETWINDGECDEYNNDAECEYDGGDCCNNDAPGWDALCKRCECLDPADQPIGILKNFIIVKFI